MSSTNTKIHSDYILAGFLLFLMALFSVFFVSPASAQIETIVGPVDTNSQDDDDDDDKKDDDNKKLSKDKYRPTGMAASALNETSVKLEWSDKAKNEDGYDIQRRVLGGTWVQIKRRGKNTESHTDATAQAGTTYEYRVRAFDVDDETDWSDIAAAKTPGLSPAEVDEIEKKKAVEEAAQEVREELEEEIKHATLNPRPDTPETVCTLASIPAAELDHAFRTRCEELTGESLSSDVPEEEVNPIEAIWARADFRRIAAIAILFIIINNVIWHMRHRTVKDRLPGER